MFVKSDDQVTYLGLIFDCNLNWRPYLHELSKRISRGIGVLSKIRRFVNRNILHQLYYSLFIGRPGWLGFRDLASPLFSLQKFRCVHMRGRASPVTETSVFATEISVTELEIFPIWTLQPGYRDCPGRTIFNCAWLVRSLTSRNAVPRVFWDPLEIFHLGNWD